ncbi:MAG: HupE/UreJ family protein [Alphaproteobacteria bacterium]
MSRLARLIAPGALLLLAAVAAQAHTSDRVFSTWTADQAGVTASVRVPAHLAARFGPGGGPALARHFLRTLQLSRGTAECESAPAPRARVTAQNATIVELAWRCPTPGPGTAAEKLSLKVDSLFARFPGHVHFARLHVPGGRLEEHILTRGSRRLTVEPDAGTTSERSWAGAMFEYTGLGIRHILAGADHLAFVIALMLAAPGLRALLFIITGFTLGHSLTLALAATGAATPVPAAIEALIGFTVAIAAVEGAGRLSGRALSAIAVTLPLAGLAIAAALFGSALPAITWAGLLLFTASYMALARRRQGWRWAAALAAAFGLVHGFGFAGVLQEIGLPGERLIPALLGFNLGVELGQIAVVALALGVAEAARRLTPEGIRGWAAHGLAAALCGLGTFWFVSRAFAG